MESYNLLQEAEQLRVQGKFERAQTICESLLRRYPDYVGALHTLGLVLADRERHQQALTIWFGPPCSIRAAGPR